MSEECLHRHHIVPRHKGGSNDPSNIELLSDYEHALTHFVRFMCGLDTYFDCRQSGWRLLPEEIQSSVKELQSMLNPMKDPTVAAKAATTQRTNGHYNRVSRRMRSNNPMHNPETAKKVSEAKSGTPLQPNHKANLSSSLRRQWEEGKRKPNPKGYRYITNGTENATIRPGEKVPEGWQYGRTNKPRPNQIDQKRISKGGLRRFLKDGENLPEGWTYGW